MSDESDKSPFEQRTKRLFDDSVLAIDAATRSRLTQARYRAIEQLAAKPRFVWRWSLVPVGTLAAAALVAWLTVWQAPPAGDTNLQAATLIDLEVLLAEEDLEMLDEELDFYGWLEEQPEFAGADDSVG